MKSASCTTASTKKGKTRRPTRRFLCSQDVAIERRRVSERHIHHTNRSCLVFHSHVVAHMHRRVGHGRASPWRDYGAVGKGAGPEVALRGIREASGLLA